MVWLNEQFNILREDIYKFSKVLWFRSTQKVISERDDFIVDALFYFEPMQGSEYRGDAFSFRGSSTSKGILQ